MSKKILRHVKFILILLRARSVTFEEVMRYFERRAVQSLSSKVSSPRAAQFPWSELSHLSSCSPLPMSSPTTKATRSAARGYS